MQCQISDLNRVVDALERLVRPRKSVAVASAAAASRPSTSRSAACTLGAPPAKRMRINNGAPHPAVSERQLLTPARSAVAASAMPATPRFDLKAMVTLRKTSAIGRVDDIRVSLALSHHIAMELSCCHRPKRCACVWKRKDKENKGNEKQE